MSYLADTRIHFAGHFQADVSTVNNDVRHFDSEKFQERYQSPQNNDHMNGWWNPEGTGAYRLLGCRITGGVLKGQAITSAEQDPAVGMMISGSNDRVCGKLVDLDPQQQLVSEIWGLKVRLGNDENPAILDSEYAVAAFIDLWGRQLVGGGGDQTMATCYQTVLENLAWSGESLSPLLSALREGSQDGLLSICFNVFSYNMDSTNPDFTIGRVVGTIGPACASEPRCFVAGRQMMPTLKNLTAPANGVYFFQGEVHDESCSCSFDFGNCLPLKDGSGALEDLGVLSMGLLKTDARNGEQIGPNDVALLGEVNYQASGWYERTAGVQDFDFSAGAWIRDNIHQRPLALLKTVSGGYQVLVVESLDGLYVRADTYVGRFNPGESRNFTFYATQYGRRLAGAEIQVGANNNLIGGGGSGKPLSPPVKIPDVGVPESAIRYAASVTTDENGSAQLTVSADPAGPGNPRVYIDGQLYGLGYALSQQPDGYNSDPWNFISCLVWDRIDIPTQPTWYDDIQPIMQQYGNLYPIMSRHLVDLGDYDSVVEHLSILDLAFSLPVSDPNYMPVTRDLSTAKRDMLLHWMRNPGPDGLPLKGHAPSAKAALAQEVSPLEAVDNLGGKTTFIKNLPSAN